MYETKFQVPKCKPYDYMERMGGQVNEYQGGRGAILITRPRSGLVSQRLAYQLP